MTVYQWLCLLGIPALIAGVFKYLHTRSSAMRMITRR